MLLGTGLRAAVRFALLTLLVPATTALADPEPAASKAPSGASSTVGLPLAFELNEGQAQPGIRALVRGRGYGVLVTEQSFVLSLTPGAKEPDDVLQFTTVGSNPAASVSGLDPLPGTVSYYVGNDPGKWRSGIRTYARIKVDSAYPGIDLIYYGNQRELEYDFVVAPGADPSAIRFEISGAEDVGLESNGDLAIATKHGTVVHRTPVVYQDIDGTRHAVDGRFVLGAGNQVSFAVGEYDRQRELVIDPSITFRSYFGGTGADQIKSIAVTSPSGLTFFGGLTTSPTLPAAANTFGGGDADGFISAMNTNGTSVLLTLFLGGVGTDTLTSLALDPARCPRFLRGDGHHQLRQLPNRERRPAHARWQLRRVRHEVQYRHLRRHTDRDDGLFDLPGRVECRPRDRGGGVDECDRLRHVRHRFDALDGFPDGRTPSSPRTRGHSTPSSRSSTRTARWRIQPSSAVRRASRRRAWRCSTGRRRPRRVRS